MAESERGSEDRAVRAMLETSYVPAAIREARERQDEWLLARYRGKPYAIADIGCGTGYHGSLFAPGCRLYHGFEIAPDIAAIARDRWRREGLRNTELFLGDVSNAPVRPATYDLVFCLYFTPGNFRDPSKEMGLYTDAYLDRNPGFIAVMSRFYEALVPGGRMFLTVYKDVPEAEAAQIDFYLHNQQEIVSPKGARFVATDAGFWSARWTRKSLLSNLGAFGVGETDVELHHLNEIAWLVEIRKPGAGSGTAASA